MYKAGYILSETATDLNVKEVAQQISGQEVMVRADRHMIDKAVDNPTQFIYVQSDFCNGDWVALINNNLWGNPDGYNYPKISSTYKSVFDPCPNGYRVAPYDLYLNFLAPGKLASQQYLFNVKGGGKTGLKRGWSFYYKGMGTFVLDENDQPVDYIDPKGTEGVDWDTDFYLMMGYRNYTTAAISDVATVNRSWCNSPTSSSVKSAGYLYTAATYTNVFDANPRGQGFTLRCVKGQ